MNVKLGLIFVLLAALTVAGVFNFDRLKSGLVLQDNADGGPVKKADLTKQQVIEFMHSQKWFDYKSKPQKLDLAAFASQKTVYIHLWASWCGPCLNEIPELIAFAKSKKDSTQFIVVSLDDSQVELEKFLKSFPELSGAPFINIWDYDKSISKKLDVDRLPMTIILRPDESTIRNIRAVVDWKSI